MVPPGALHGAVRKYLQVKSSSAVQLSPPEDPLEVREIRGCAPREQIPGDQRLPEQRAGAVPERGQHEVGADLRDPFDPENASNVPQESGRSRGHGVRRGAGKVQRGGPEDARLRTALPARHLLHVHLQTVRERGRTQGKTKKKNPPKTPLNSPLPVAPIGMFYSSSSSYYYYCFEMGAGSSWLASGLLSVIMPLRGRSLVPPWSRG